MCSQVVGREARGDPLISSYLYVICLKISGYLDRSSRW